MVETKKLTPCLRIPDRKKARSARTKHRPSLVRARWLLLLLFPVGYIVSYQAFPYSGAEYLVLSLVSAGACAMLVTRLDASINVTLPVWVLLGIFCTGYYLQSYLLAWDSAIYPAHVVVVRDASEDLLMDAYKTTTLAFVTFCLTAWLMLGIKRLWRCAAGPQNLAASITARCAKFVTNLLLITIPPLEVVLGYISWATGITVMGAENAQLPYRLAGGIFYTRFVILPGLLLLLIWLADRLEFRGRFRIGVALLIAHGIAEAILRSSRASLLFSLLGLMFLFVLSQRLTRPRLRWIAGGLVLVLLMFPVITVYRDLRIGSNPSDVAAPLRESIGYTYGAGAIGKTYSNAFVDILFRVGGTGELLPIQASGLGPLGILQASHVSRFVIREVYLISPTWINAIAPSLVGWFYLVGGNPGVLFGILGFVMVTLLFWRGLASRSVRARPFAQALFLTFLVLIASEGTLDLSFWTVFGVVLTIAGAELLLRLPHRRRVPIPAVVKPAAADAIRP